MADLVTVVNNYFNQVKQEKYVIPSLVYISQDNNKKVIIQCHKCNNIFTMAKEEYYNNNYCYCDKCRTKMKLHIPFTGK